LPKVPDVFIATKKFTAVAFVKATGVAGVSVIFVVAGVHAGLAAKVTTASVPSKLPAVPPESSYKAIPEPAPVAIAKKSDVARPVPVKFTVTEVSVWPAASAVTVTFAISVAGEVAIIGAPGNPEFIAPCAVVILGAAKATDGTRSSPEIPTDHNIVVIVKDTLVAFRKKGLNCCFVIIEKENPSSIDSA
tara:strand:+ start:108 stop:677 length:570 start_codon:yes stop_codon:yes gene_type:complete